MSFYQADIDWMDYGAKHGLIKSDTRFDLLGNRLVLIAPKDSAIGNVNIVRASISPLSPKAGVSPSATCARSRRPLCQSSAGEARLLGRG